MRLCFVHRYQPLVPPAEARKRTLEHMQSITTTALHTLAAPAQDGGITLKG